MLDYNAMRYDDRRTRVAMRWHTVDLDATGVYEIHTPPESTILGKTSLRSTESGGGAQVLLLGLHGKGVKEVLLRY